MNVVFEIAELTEETGAANVSIVYCGSEDTIAVSGLGEAILDAAQAQGRQVVPLIDTVRVNSSMIIKPAPGKVFCYAGCIVEGDNVPEPWQVADVASIIVEMDKDSAKQQELFKMLSMVEIAEALCKMFNEDQPDKYSLHLVERLKVSTFRQDLWNQLRNTTAYLIKL